MAMLHQYNRRTTWILPQSVNSGDCGFCGFGTMSQAIYRGDQNALRKIFNDISVARLSKIVPGVGGLRDGKIKR
jgi:hypothetical protein